jgi:hypothetical protein
MHAAAAPRRRWPQTTSAGTVPATRAASSSPADHSPAGTKSERHRHHAQRLAYDALEVRDGCP